MNISSYDAISIYTDASFSKGDGIAVIGYGFFLEEDQHIEGSLQEKKWVIQQIQETNNIRAEIRASLTALEVCPQAKKTVLYTDCQTTAGLLSRREKLERTNFISQSKNRELNNADLYRAFYKLYDKTGVEIVWVKGHTSQKNNHIQRNFSHLDKEVRKVLRLNLKA